MHKRAVFASQRYKQTSDFKSAAGLVKYMQYRDDGAPDLRKEENRDKDIPSGHIRQIDDEGNPIQRWVNRGMGDNAREIINNAHDTQTQTLKNNIGMRYLLIGPEPDTLAAIPEKQQRNVVAEVTDRTMTRWFEEQGKPVPEYSYVIHEKPIVEAERSGPQTTNAKQTNTFIPTWFWLQPHLILTAQEVRTSSKRRNLSC